MMKHFVFSILMMAFLATHQAIAVDSRCLVQGSPFLLDEDAAKANTNGYLLYSDKQNVSSDIIGTPRAAAVIEGYETHARTGAININLEHVRGIEKDILEMIKDQVTSIQVTQTVIYGWYDNEMASYVNMLGDRIISIAEAMY